MSAVSEEGGLTGAEVSVDGEAVADSVFSSGWLGAVSGFVGGSGSVFFISGGGAIGVGVDSLGAAIVLFCMD